MYKESSLIRVRVFNESRRLNPFARTEQLYNDENFKIYLEGEGKGDDFATLTRLRRKIEGTGTSRFPRRISFVTTERYYCQLPLSLSQETERERERKRDAVRNCDPFARRSL